MKLNEAFLNANKGYLIDRANFEVYQKCWTIFQFFRRLRNGDVPAKYLEDVILKTEWSVQNNKYSIHLYVFRGRQAALSSFCLFLLPN